MKNIGENRYYSGFGVAEVKEAMELVDEELANKQLECGRTSHGFALWLRPLNIKTNSAIDDSQGD
jgi:hypothetical protein